MYPVQELAANQSWLPEVSMPLPQLKLPNMKTVTKVAPLAVAMFACIQAPKAEAGPLLEIFCYAGCSAMPLANPTLLAWVPQCLEYCTLTGLLPTW